MLIEVRPLGERDLPEADRIFRLAFGTFIGLPDPMSFIGDAELVGPRWRAAPEAALGAYVDGALVGSNFAANWGSFGFFGPLTVRPDFWGQGVAPKLLAATMRPLRELGYAPRGAVHLRQQPHAHRAVPQIRLSTAVADAGAVEAGRARCPSRAVVSLLGGPAGRPRPVPRRLSRAHRGGASGARRAG